MSLLPGFPSEASMERGAHPQSRVLCLQVPVKRDAPFPEPSFHCMSQFPANEPPSHFPSGTHMERDTHTEPSASHPLKIHLSLRVPGKGSPSMFPNRVPMERDTPSPEPLVYPFMCARVPKKGALQNVKKHKVIVHIAPCRQKAYIQWGAAWFPKGIVNDTALCTPVPCSPQHDTFHLGLGRPEPR